MPPKRSFGSGLFDAVIASGNVTDSRTSASKSRDPIEPSWQIEDLSRQTLADEIGAIKT